MEYTQNDIDNNCDDEMDFVQWLDQEGFINTHNRPCTQCNAQMVVERFGGNVDGVCMRCPDQDCRHHETVRKWSFFQPSALSLIVQMRLIIAFAADASVMSTSSQYSLSRTTVTNYFDNIRGRWRDDLAANPIQFNDGGIYEVDECQLKHIQDSQGNVLQYVWVAGILERATGQVRMYRVPSRSNQSLIPPITQHVPAGAFIFSDELTTYFALEDPNYCFYHLTVNHSNGEYSRTDNIPGVGNIQVHTNTIEGAWSVLRSRLRYRTRKNLERVDMYLDELMYRRSGRSLFDPIKY